MAEHGSFLVKQIRLAEEIWALGDGYYPDDYNDNDEDNEPIDRVQDAVMAQSEEMNSHYSKDQVHEYHKQFYKRIQEPENTIEVESPKKRIIGFTKQHHIKESSLQIQPFLTENTINVSMKDYLCYQKGYVISDGTVLVVVDELKTKENDMKKEKLITLNNFLFRSLIPLNIHNKTITEEIFSNQVERIQNITSSSTLNANKGSEIDLKLLSPLHGPDCTDSLCAACQLLVEEFTQIVLREVNNPETEFFETVMNNFCAEKSVIMKYREIVSYVCTQLFQDRIEYMEFAYNVFGEQHWNDWGGLTKPGVVLGNKLLFCESIGICPKNSLMVNTLPITYKQKDWKLDCFLCQAIAKLIETQALLQRAITDSSAVSLVRDACSGLLFPSIEAEEACVRIVHENIDDIAWLVKLHVDNVAKRPLGTGTGINFQEKLCEELKYCERWIDPVVLAEKLAEQEIEVLYS